MKPTDLFNDLQSKVSEVLRNSPAKDIEKNVRSMMTQGFAKLDLVTREEFDVQSQVLARTRARLEELEMRVADLERRAGMAGAAGVGPATVGTAGAGTTASATSVPGSTTPEPGTGPTNPGLAG
ncbi:Ubiquinone biosynthesis accessory factor UbiK [Cupriavidus sp. H18C1]|nr:hypothetical protein B551_0216450 [Cupriavidus sp. HPC(L)]